MVSFSKLLTIGEDSILNVYNAKSTENLSKIDLDKEFYAMASNQIDRIAIGGDQNQVDIHQINGDEISLREPYLAMKFETAVQRIQWFGKYVLGCAEDSQVQVFNTETEKVMHFKPGHDGSLKNAAMDPLGEYVATSGCDGMVHIY